MLVLGERFGGHFSALTARVVREVYRRPTTARGTWFGWTYGDTRILSSGESVAPLAARDAIVHVADLIPGGQP